MSGYKKGVNPYYANVRDVLAKLDEFIEKGKAVEIDEVYNVLSIFDWWKERLTVKDMKTMRAFLRTALKHGFDGYTTFRVGAAGYSNGMWAYTAHSTNGYSPDDGDILFRTFTPSYTGWNVFRDGEGWYSQKDVSFRELRPHL